MLFWIFLILVFLYFYYEWHWWKAECRRIEFNRTRPGRFAEYGEEDILPTLLTVDELEMFRNVFRDQEIPSDSSQVVSELEQAVQASLGPTKKITLDLKQVAKLIYSKLYGNESTTSNNPDNPVPPQKNSSSILHSNSKIHVLWTPALVDWMLSWYRQSYERDLIDAGCTRIVIDTVPIYIRIGSSDLLKPPIVMLHGISTAMGGAVELMNANPDRTFILPQNPTLSWGRDMHQFMTTLQFTQAITKFIQHRHYKTVHVAAWSYGGFVRNYLSVLLAACDIDISREALIEPMGMPLSNAIGSTCCLMSIRDAWKRAMYYCPDSNGWMQAAIIVYLRLYRNVRPLITDAFWNRYSLGETWNHKGMKILLADQDFIPPIQHILDYKNRKLPLASVEITKGEHGTWPYLPEYVGVVSQWLSSD